MGAGYEDEISLTCYDRPETTGFYGWQCGARFNCRWMNDGFDHGMHGMTRKKAISRYRLADRTPGGGHK